jgi:hypothetical protein
MMAKISTILPSNPRITSTDVSHERPVRPGTPSFGQPIAQTADPRNEFQKVEVTDEDMAKFSGYGANGKRGESAPVQIQAGALTPSAMQVKDEKEQKLKADLAAVERVNDGFIPKLNVRA